MRTLPTDRVFSRDELRELGWTDSAVTRGIASGKLVRLRRGVLTTAAAVAEADTTTDTTTDAHARAAVRAIAGSVLSHRTALLMYGLPVVGPPPRVPEITVAPNARGSAHRVLLHRATTADRDVVDVGGDPVTSPARTVIDVARAQPVRTSVAAIDAALQRSLVTVADLDDVVTRCWNWPGIARAHRSMRRVDGRAESALESVSRLAIADLGLPAPMLQPRVSNRYGTVVGRLDFYWDEFGVAGEADGRSKYRTRSALLTEKERQEVLELDGLVFTRWDWDMAWARPHLLRTKVLDAFERGIARDRSGLPRLWSVRPAKPVTGEENLIERTRARKR